jgi:hypothetical protein
MEDGVFDALFNISESPIQNHTLTWKFLWPLHLTLPPFIRAYYGDSFDYIGKKAVEQISLMETMPSNFKQKLEKAPSELLQTVDPSPNIIMIISDSQNTILNGGSYNKVLSSWLNKPPLRTLLKQKLDAQENIKLNFVKFMSDCVPLLCANKRYEDSGLLADFLLSINLNSTTNAVWELGLSLCSAQLFGLENNYLSIFINKYGGSKSVKSTFRDFLSTMKSIKTAMPLEIRDRMTELFGQLADFEK